MGLSTIDAAGMRQRFHVFTYVAPAQRLGGACPRIAAVARERHVECIFLIASGTYFWHLRRILRLFNVVIEKMSQNGVFAVGFLFSDRLLALSG